MTSTLHVMDSTGDTRIEWDPSDPVSVKVAREAFETAKKKKHLIYRLDSRGQRGALMREFDPRAERIIATPQTVGG
jgi:hypothetical protein